MSQFHRLVGGYVKKWASQGYPLDIPDEVPAGLMREQLAPSYRELAIAILKNDPAMIGAVIPSSDWYNELKRIEIMQREPEGVSAVKEPEQVGLFGNQSRPVVKPTGPSLEQVRETIRRRDEALGRASMTAGPLVYFDGETYDPVLDQARLSSLLYRVWALMADGKFRTLLVIADATGGSEAGVSARLRDYRKARFGGHSVERIRLTGGLFAYRVVRRVRE